MELPDRYQSFQPPDSGAIAEANFLTPCASQNSAIGCAPVDGSVPGHRSTDARIIDGLRRLSESDDDYWTFRGRATRRQTHGLTQYPAMMVPAMQAELIGVVADADDQVTRVFDPFAGSGTTLVECMRLGLDFLGQDINPLAVLLCRTKMGPFNTARLTTVVTDVVKSSEADRGTNVESSFRGLEKWFCPEAITQLSRIRRAIRSVDDVWCRRALWTSLAETVRLTSNSRTSTFKLHVRTADELDSRDVQPLATFTTVARDIAQRLDQEAEILRQAGYLSEDGSYCGHVEIRLRDSTTVAAPESDDYDLLVTSPPYGDNTTTVPYGQYSYLPLQWIDLHDIDDGADSSYLRSTCEIDYRSLGGKKRNAVSEAAHLLDVSPSLTETLRRLAELPPDRKRRVAAFCRDLEAALGAVLTALRPRAYMIWTVGNRRVGGQPVPTDAILTELLASHQVHLVTRIDRRIPNKRMAIRNDIAKTMRKSPFSYSERDHRRHETQPHVRHQRRRGLSVRRGTNY